MDMVVVDYEQKYKELAEKEKIRNARNSAHVKRWMENHREEYLERKKEYNRVAYESRKAQNKIYYQRKKAEKQNQEM